MAPINSTGTSLKKTGLAAIFMDDDENETSGPPITRFRDAAVHAASSALNNTFFLVMLWTAAVVARQVIRGGEVHVLKHAPKVAMFAAAYFLIDVSVALYWPDMTENLVQAGMFHIATVMFACLPETD